MRYAIGGDNILGIKRANGATVPLALQYSPEYIDTVEKVRRTPVVTGDGRSIPLGEIADVSVRKLPEMIRNDNGQLAGYIYVDLQGVTASDYVEKAKAFLAKELELANGIFDGVDGPLSIHRSSTRPVAIHCAADAGDHFCAC